MNERYRKQLRTKTPKERRQIIAHGLVRASSAKFVGELVLINKNLFRPKPRRAQKRQAIRSKMPKTARILPITRATTQTPAVTTML